MWDLLITVGNLIVIPALLATALDKHAYVPRVTSGVSIVGLALVITGLFGAGLLFGPVVLIVMDAVWVYIFLFRNRPVPSPIVEVQE